MLLIAPVIAENVSATTYYWSPFNNCTVRISEGSSGSYNTQASLKDVPTFNTATGVATMNMHLEGYLGATGEMYSMIDVKGNTFTATSTSHTVCFVWWLEANAVIKSIDAKSYAQLQVWGRLYKSDGSQFATTKMGTWTVTSNSNGMPQYGSLSTFYTLQVTYSGLTVGQTYTLDTVLYGVIHVNMVAGYPYGSLNVNLGSGHETALYYESVD